MAKCLSIVRLVSFVGVTSNNQTIFPPAALITPKSRVVIITPTLMPLFPLVDALGRRFGFLFYLETAGWLPSLIICFVLPLFIDSTYRLTDINNGTRLHVTLIRYVIIFLYTRLPEQTRSDLQERQLGALVLLSDNLCMQWHITMGRSIITFVVIITIMLKICS